jgi:hypothetical protein
MGAEHDQTQKAIVLTGYPEALATVTASHNAFKNITRRPRVADIQQGLKLLPGSQLQRHLLHNGCSHQLNPTTKAGGRVDGNAGKHWGVAR